MVIRPDGYMPDQRPLTPQSRDAIASIFHLYDPPLWLVTAHANGRRGGMIASSLARASIVAELPRILIAIARHHHTWGLIEASGRFALHLLPVDHLEPVWRFGLESGHQVDKLAGLTLEETTDGNPRYSPCAAWMDCRIEASVDIGDRSVYVADVVDGRTFSQGPVLTVGRLMQEVPPERERELKRLYACDQEIDAAAIRAWRQGAPST